MTVVIEKLDHLPINRQRVEVVERKGIGHPDSICDAVMEQASLALCREYTRLSGRILHHNLDKGLLVAGGSIGEPALASVLSPGPSAFTGIFVEEPLPPIVG